MRKEASTENLTYRELYNEGNSALSMALEEEREAQLDARLLLEHVCGTSLQTLLLDGKRPVTDNEAELYRRLLKRRCSREPLAYILGKWDFMGLEFGVSSDVLIPEQDTENLVEEVMREVCDGDRILDLCTGSGCILLSLLNYSNGSTGVGTDLSEGAIAVAKEKSSILSSQIPPISGVKRSVNWLPKYGSTNPGWRWTEETTGFISTKGSYLRRQTISGQAECFFWK